RVLPVEDSKPLSRASPLIQRKRSRGTLVTVEKADPCVLRQGRPWERTIGPGAGFTSEGHSSHTSVPGRHCERSKATSPLAARWIASALAMTWIVQSHPYKAESRTRRSHPAF